jgi:hypothetical protein
MVPSVLELGKMGCIIQNLVIEVAEAVLQFNRVLRQAHPQSMPYDFHPFPPQMVSNESVQ